MKRMTAVILAVIFASTVLTGCKNSSNNDSSADSSASASTSGNETKTEISSKETTDTIEEHIPDGSDNAELYGSWYSESTGETLIFGEDDTLGIEVDYSSLMHFEGDKFVLFEGEASFEQEDSTVTIYIESDSLEIEIGSSEDADDSDKKIQFMVMEKIDSDDDKSVDGTYKLTGGELYTELAEIYAIIEGSSPLITVDGESLKLAVSLCDYAAEDGKLVLIGDGAALFGFDSDETAICEYEADNDKLTIEFADTVLEYVRPVPEDSDEESDEEE